VTQPDKTPSTTPIDTAIAGESPPRLTTVISLALNLPERAISAAGVVSLLTSRQRDEVAIAALPIRPPLKDEQALVRRNDVSKLETVIIQDAI
jgi:hypothetical protein